MMRSTEYKAVSAVLLSVVVLAVSWTVNGGGTVMVGVGVEAVVAAGVLTVGVAATAAVATGTDEAVVVSVANAAAELS